MLQKGTGYYKRKNKRRLFLLAKEIDMRPEDTGLYLTAAFLHFQLEEFDKCLKNLKKAKKLDNNFDTIEHFINFVEKAKDTTLDLLI